MSQQFRRIVVRSPNWLGDAVMSLPALECLRRHFADAALAVAAPATLAPLFSVVDGVDAVVSLQPASGLAAFGRWRANARILSEQKFDLAILLPNSFSAAWTVCAAGIPERWGYATDLRRWTLTRAVPRPRERGVVKHQSRYYLDLVRALDVTGEAAPPRRVTVTADARARARVLLERNRCDMSATLVGFAPGAAYGHAKRWPPVRFAALAARLKRELGATTVLVGSDSDRDAGREIESWPGSSVAGCGEHANTVNLIGRTDIPLLMGVLTWCRLFVSNDSGAMHLAAAVGLPVTALFGPTDERATAPMGDHQVLTSPAWCRPCMLRECPIDHRCLTGVSVEAVFDAVARQLA